jgi:1,4-alpha-glucan branching enzyme
MSLEHSSIAQQSPKTEKTKMQPRNTRTGTVARPVAPISKTAERPLEKPVDFILKRPEARSASLAGNFNGWDPKRNPMRKDAKGWRTTVWLPPGRYEYRFVVDGEWLSDPEAKESAANDFGSTNSVVTV